MATKRGISAEKMRAVLMDAIQAGTTDSAARETIRQFFDGRDPNADERMGLIAILMKLDMEKSGKKAPRNRGDSPTGKACGGLV